MKKTFFLLLLSAFSASCQDFGKMEFVCDLPALLKEVSGIEVFPGSDIVWAINDSRNPPEVYGVDPQTGKIQQTIRLKNGTNIDWEDLATDPGGTLYIGDFGNNGNYRQDLKIYHLGNPGNLEKRRYEAKVTSFAYEDQTEFPPKKKDLTYDVEGFVFLKDHFYLFTRNRQKKFDGKVRIYKVPATPGHHQARVVGTFKTCDDAKDCQVTSASIHHESGRLALLSYNKVWLFDDYPDDDFTSGTVTKIKLDHSSQKESVCFRSKNELYIADEKTHRGRNLYLLNLDQ